MTAVGDSSSEKDELLDDAACALLRTDADGVILRVNRTFCDWVGYSKDELIGRRKLQELFSMGARIFHQTHWTPLMQLQGSISEVKLQVQHRNGDSIPMVLNARRHQRSGVTVHEVAAFIARDRDKYEQELIRSRKEMQRLAEEANGLKRLADQMIGIVSHDLRTPLAVIKMSALSLTKSEASPIQRNAFERITRASTRAAHLINDLLDFSQVRLSNGLAVQAVPGDIHSAVAENVDELRVAFPDRDIDHRVEGMGSCMFDAKRMAQVITNLVSNAVAYGADASKITVTSTIDQTNFGVSVHNLGPSIPLSVQDSIFEPMVRGQQSAGANHSVGLGLFISSQIVKAHGGTLSVNSSGAEGTKFSAIIPREADAS